MTKVTLRDFIAAIRQNGYPKIQGDFFLGALIETDADGNLLDDMPDNRYVHPSKSGACALGQGMFNILGEKALSWDIDIDGFCKKINANVMHVSSNEWREDAEVDESSSLLENFPSLTFSSYVASLNDNTDFTIQEIADKVEKRFAGYLDVEVFEVPE